MQLKYLARFYLFISFLVIVTSGTVWEHVAFVSGVTGGAALMGMKCASLPPGRLVTMLLIMSNVLVMGTFLGAYGMFVILWYCGFQRSFGWAVADVVLLQLVAGVEGYSRGLKRFRPP